MAYDRVYPKIGDEILPFDKGQEDRISNAIDVIKDYPIEQSAGYEKWASGKVVQYGQSTINWETSKTLGSSGLFYGGEIKIDLPRQFGLVPEIYFELVVGNTIAWTLLRTVTSTSFYFIVISPFQYTSTRSDKVHWRAIGR